MKIFKEYLLEKKCFTNQTLYLPTNSEAVMVNDTKKGLLLQVITDTNIYTTELRTFKVCMNDENIYADAVKYIGSFDSAAGIRHIVEIIGEV